MDYGQLGAFLGGVAAVITALAGLLKGNLLPYSTKLKQWLITEKDAALKLDSLRTLHVLTIIFRSDAPVGAEPARLSYVSPAAVRFFGYQEGSENKLLGKTAEDLMVILREYMNKEDYDKFLDDQRRVQEMLQRDQYVRANVPMKINETHPYPEFRNKEYFPVVALSSERTQRKSHGQYLTVLYLDLNALPAIA